MTASGRFWTIDRLRHTLSQLESCRSIILQHLREDDMDDDMRAYLDVKTDVYTRTIETLQRQIRELEEDDHDA